MIDKFIKYFLVISSIYQINVFAQSSNDADSTKSFFAKNIYVTGDLGTYGELYSISGRAKRRPSATGRIYFRPTLHLFKLIDIPFEFLISTEGSSARQNINQFGINPTWSWGNLHLGDFSEIFSNYSLGGINIRGAGLTITPGQFSLSVVGGYTQRAVQGGASNGSYDRYLYGAKIGLGKSSGSNFNLLFLRVRDKPSSLPSAAPSITVLSPNGGDVFPIGSIQTIRWTSVNLPGGVVIEVSRDGGSTYSVLFTNEPNTGSVSWTVTGTQSFQAVIKIISLDDSTIYDISDEEFSIGSNVPGQAGNIAPVVSNGAAVTPQENLVGGLTWKILFLNNKLSWQSEVDGSVYTRDMRAETINLDSVSIPNFVKGIYSPKISSSVDYSVNTELGFNLNSVNAKIGYKFIGPGYTSLGLPYLINDQQEFTAMTSFRISRFGVNLNWARYNDNLIDQKLYTTIRNQYNLSLSGMITSYWNGNITTTILNMGNNSNNDTTKVNFSTFLLSTTHSFMFSRSSVLRTVTLSYNYQSSGDSSPLRKGTTSISNNLTFGLNFQVTKTITANASAGFIASTYADTIKSKTQVFSIGAQESFLNRKLTASINLSNSSTGSDNAFNLNISSGYKISKADNIYLSILSNNFKGGSLGSSYHEYITSLTISHRF